MVNAALAQPLAAWLRQEILSIEPAQLCTA
jgi:hypothetical protein